MNITFFACAALAIAGALFGLPWLHWATKPVATLILLAMVAGVPGRYGRAVAVGLAFAAAGDTFLMLPGDWFLPGLGCFLLTHLAYLVALTADVRLAARPAAFAGAAVLAAAMIAVLWPGLPGAMRGPVIVYALVLGAMAAQAVARAQVLGTPSARLAAAGGVLFLASDAMLAINRFAVPLPLSPLWILASYYAAQWLFARSALTTAAAPFNVAPRHERTPG